MNLDHVFINQLHTLNGSYIPYIPYNLVGGWTNPFEKYARPNGFIFPKVRVEDSQKKWNRHHPDMFIDAKTGTCWMQIAF